ncbi:response regulator transcription factor [Pseudooceanicola sp. C21-150M6]|uniref:response regulator transcription factor n=1 Tax=Pseudooceanicola sp. C21-150M6 TaxID=3434355 RepID=UPI003D7F8F36
MRILITDSTWNMAIIGRNLRDAGFYVTEAADGDDILEFLKTSQQDAVVLDVDLPHMTACELLRQIRRVDPHIPVCIGAKNWSEADSLKALIAGADDTFTFDHDEADALPARLRAYVRRVAGFASSEVTVGDLQIDIDRQVVRFGDLPIRLTRLEYELVETLVLRGGALITRDDIMVQLYAFQDEPDAKIIDVYICRIRAKLMAAGASHNFISTAFAQGYRLCAQPIPERAVAA